MTGAPAFAPRIWRLLVLPWRLDSRVDRIPASPNGCWHSSAHHAKKIRQKTRSAMRTTVPNLGGRSPPCQSRAFEGRLKEASQEHETMAAARKIVIVGGGPAGVGAAIAARQHDASADVTLLDEETAEPY